MDMKVIVRNLQDNYKPPLAFQQWNRDLLLEWEAENITYLIQLNARKPLVVSIPQKNEELKLNNLV
jgi:hypothetical protein